MVVKQSDYCRLNGQNMIARCPTQQSSRSSWCAGGLSRARRPVEVDGFVGLLVTHERFGRGAIAAGYVEVYKMTVRPVAARFQTFFQGRVHGGVLRLGFVVHVRI